MFANSTVALVRLRHSLSANYFLLQRLLFHFGVRFLTSSSSLRIVPVPLPLPLLFCICVCPFSVCSFFFSFLRVSCPSSYFCLFSSFSFSSYSSFFFLFLFFRLLSRSLFFFFLSSFSLFCVVSSSSFFFLFFSLKFCFPRVLCLSVFLVGPFLILFFQLQVHTPSHMLQFRSGDVKIPPVKN